MDVTMDARIVLREERDLPDAAPLRFLDPLNGFGVRRRNVREGVGAIADRGDAADARVRNPRCGRERPCHLAEAGYAADNRVDFLVSDRPLYRGSGLGEV